MAVLPSMFLTITKDDQKNFNENIMNFEAIPINLMQRTNNLYAKWIKIKQTDLVS